MVPDDPDPNPMVPLICFLSGAAALIFESVWFHRASLVFGSSVWSTSLVLSSFMAGLTLGSALVGLTGAGARGALAHRKALSAGTPPAFPARSRPLSHTGAAPPRGRGPAPPVRS